MDDASSDIEDDLQHDAASGDEDDGIEEESDASEDDDDEVCFMSIFIYSFEYIVIKLSFAQDENVNWDQTFLPHLDDFQGPNEQIKPDFLQDSGTSPLDILRKFMDDGMVQKIVTESNRYAEQVKWTSPRAFVGWTPVNAAEIWRFLALILNMTIVKKLSYKEYWSTDPLVSTPFFGTVMSRDRYL